MSVFGKFPRTFWVANVIELFERWAWYGFFMLFANYLTGSSDAGGLEFTQEQKGWLMGVGTGILYFRFRHFLYDGEYRGFLRASCYFAF